MKAGSILASILLCVPLCAISCAAIPADTFTVKAKTNNAAKSWSEQKTTLLKHVTGLNPSSVELSLYGGRTDRKDRATGFFYTKRTPDGWVLVDPEGCHYLSIGVCSTSPNDDQADHREHFAGMFADGSDWARKTRALLAGSLRFNSLGCWSDWKTFKSAEADIPYVRRWNLMASYARKKGLSYPKYGHVGFRDDVLPVFDKAFATHCDEVCREMEETRNDPWLIGHFSDNELPFKSKGIIHRYLKSAPDEESHTAAARFLEENGLTKNAIQAKHDIEFTALVLRTYYKTVHDAIRKHDPNHLILGSRLHGIASGQDVCYKACGPFVDVVSINYYNRWTPLQDELNRRASLAEKPILITEWYAKGADSGLNNDKGAGFTVPTQKDRGSFYENFAIGLLKNRNVVGWHWFRYIDDGDLKTNGNSSNKGIVDLRYKEYPALADSMRAINSAAYRLSDLFRGSLSITHSSEDDKTNNLMQEEQRPAAED